MGSDERARVLYEGLLRGEVAGADDALRPLRESTSPADRAWALALRAARWHAEPGAVDLPSVEECAALSGAAATAEPIAIAAHHAARASSLALESAAPWIALLDRVAPDALETAITRAFERVLGGDVAGLGDALANAAERAQGLGLSALAVDALALRALAAEVAGDSMAALDHARLASRTSRAAKLPQSEYLANLVLARQRRLAGLPHLAAHILSALARVAPAQWVPWLSWELVLAGALDGARSDGRTPAAAIHRLLEAASEGAHERFRERAHELYTAARTRPHRDDAASLVACTDPFGAPDSAREWIFGETNVPPRGLWGLSAALRPSEAETALAVVVAAPGATARRVLWTGAPIAVAHLAPSPLAQTKRKQGRMDGTIATLCLAGDEGLEDAELFHRVYQLRFAPHLHRGVLDVLLHRVRERLEGLGTLERTGGRTAIRLERAILVPDPRCGRPIDDRLLYFLATGGHTSAKEAARALAVPLRTAQAALQALVDDGSCVRQRRGNAVEYGVEDTTFSEPTRH